MELRRGVGWLGSLVGVRSPRVAMPSTSPSDERTCDTTTLLRRYLYLSTWFLTAPSFLSLLAAFSISVSVAFLIPGYTSLARFHFVPLPPNADCSGELSARASDFSVLLALPGTFPITRLLIAIRFPNNLQKFVKGQASQDETIRNSICPLSFFLIERYKIYS